MENLRNQEWQQSAHRAGKFTASETKTDISQKSVKSNDTQKEQGYQKSDKGKLGKVKEIFP